MRDSSTIKNIIFPAILVVFFSFLVFGVCTYSCIRDGGEYKPKEIKEKYEITFSNHGKEIGVVLTVVGTPGKPEWIVAQQDFARKDTADIVLFKKIKKRDVE